MLTFYININLMAINQLPPNNNAQFSPNEIPDLGFIQSLEQKKVKKGTVKDLAKGMAEIAYSIGHTNDADEFAEVVSEDIMEAWETLRKKRKKK
eukprot:COSAG01_NODE_740_length_13891_cov_35.573013_7_plen_94_part_00